MKVVEILNIAKYEGSIPVGHDLVIYEKGSDPLDGFCLMGFDEVGLFDGEFDVPVYAFVEGI